MDDKRFDDLSRRLAVPLTRGGFFKTLSALGGSALAAITGLDLAEAKKGKGGGKKGKGGGKKGKKKGKKKGNRGQQGSGQLARNDSPVTGQASCADLALCHCSPPDNPGNCQVICPNSSGVACNGHGNSPNEHEADCICGGPAIECEGYTIPACPPDRCGANAQQNAECGTGSICAGECSTTEPTCPDLADCRCVIDPGQTTGACETNQICEGVCNNDLPCPGVTDCECVEGTCQTVVQTCDGPCTRNNPTCPDLANCRCVVPEGETDGTCSTDQTCAGVCNTTDLLCPDVADCECVISDGANFGTCETVVTCEGACTRNNPTCPDLADCRCVIDPGQTEGVCETNQICEGVCNDTDLLCPDVADCECFIAQGENFGTCETVQTCAGSCDLQDPTCPDLADCRCVIDPGQTTGACETNQICEGVCNNDLPCPEVGTCECVEGTCTEITPICPGTCSAEDPNCPGEDCVCIGIGVVEQPICGVCVPDNQPANNAGECCGTDFCPNANGVGGICAACPPAPTPTPTPEVPRRRRKKKKKCPRSYNGLAQSPCSGKCRCKGGRRCKKGRCCEKQGTHCDSNAECCSGTCEWVHDNHRQCA